MLALPSERRALTGLQKPFLNGCKVLTHLEMVLQFGESSGRRVEGSVNFGCRFGRVYGLGFFLSTLSVPFSLEIRV